jgi:integrase
VPRDSPQSSCRSTWRFIGGGHIGSPEATKRGTVRSNPFAELPLPTTITKRDRVLSDEEAAAVWRAAGEDPFGAMVRLLMLTGQRREEVAGMTWAELSEDLATWTIPATRTKNGIPHIVPLASQHASFSTPSRPTSQRMSNPRRGERTSRLCSPASAEHPLADGQKRSRRSILHRVFPVGGCTTCAERWRQGCSASACASK